MANKIEVAFSWSTGKDAALALYYLRQDKRYTIQHLLTSINSHYDRVTMHGLRRSLLIRQAEAIGLPFSTVELPQEPSMEVYETQLSEALLNLREGGISQIAFGDIFLEDLRQYREQQLQTLQLQALFPLWKRDTRKLFQTFLELGFKAVVVCVKSAVLDASFVGRTLDQSFLDDLPPNVDPCGENGEFHTFCYDGPIFQQPISFSIGEPTFKSYRAPKEAESPPNACDDNLGFWFCDLY